MLRVGLSAVECWRPKVIYPNFVGLDVHARTIVGCVIDVDTGEVVHRRFGYELAEVVAQDSFAAWCVEIGI